MILHLFNTLSIEWFALWTLDVEIPGSIPGGINLGTKFSKLVVASAPEWITSLWYLQYGKFPSSRHLAQIIIIDKTVDINYMTI